MKIILINYHLNNQKKIIVPFPYLALLSLHSHFWKLKDRDYSKSIQKVY